ncbi:trichohyalin-like [Wyeomyia smithii]|uniref:trichohyalin-like n=1 Tax=Wyeomyia smithii TaxID=174621 RepID=UPI002467FA28|nr:trichohyalin-like [Wyeomyia smithii]
MNRTKINTKVVYLGTAVLVLRLIPFTSGLRDRFAVDIDESCDEVSDGSRFHSDRRVDRLDQDQEQRLLFFNREVVNAQRDLERGDKPQLDDIRERRNERRVAGDELDERRSEGRQVRLGRERDREIDVRDREIIEERYGSRNDERRYRNEAREDRLGSRNDDDRVREERRNERDQERRETQRVDGRRERREREDRAMIREERADRREQRQEREEQQYRENRHESREDRLEREDRREREDYREREDHRDRSILEDRQREERSDRIDSVRRVASDDDRRERQTLEREEKTSTDRSENDRHTRRVEHFEDDRQDSRSRSRREREDRNDRRERDMGDQSFQPEDLLSNENFNSSFIWSVVQAALIMYIGFQLMKKSEQQGTWKPLKLANLVKFHDSATVAH